MAILGVVDDASNFIRSCYQVVIEELLLRPRVLCG